MTKESTKEKIGSWAFLIGVVIALVLGIYYGYINKEINSLGILVLVIIGILVGFLNISGKEVTPFLLSGAVLIIASNLGQALLSTTSGMTGNILSAILIALLAIFVPSTIVVAIKNVFALAKDK
ncbi:MAG TPA: hypothetical protein P5277_02165 [Candidatus Paceibacterota bacterium]|nr:hypothetical protein [Candidatus Paceibacterota bacterium]